MTKNRVEAIFISVCITLLVIWTTIGWVWDWEPLASWLTLGDSPPPAIMLAFIWFFGTIIAVQLGIGAIMLPIAVVFIFGMAIFGE